MHILTHLIAAWIGATVAIAALAIVQVGGDD